MSWPYIDDKGSELVFLETTGVNVHKLSSGMPDAWYMILHRFLSKVITADCPIKLMAQARHKSNSIPNKSDV
jgi:hypothetical protein